MAAISTREGLKIIVALKANIPSIGLVHDEAMAFDMVKAVLAVTFSFRDRAAALQACTVYFTRRDSRLDRLPLFEKLSPVFRRPDALLELRTFVACRKRTVVVGGCSSRSNRVNATLRSMFGGDTEFEFKRDTELNTISC